jgi:phage-related minor tail protein
MLKNANKSIGGAILFALSVTSSFAQGVQGITAAESSLLGYVDPVASLCLVIGAVVGIIGGVRVYIKWNSGDQDINKELMGWGGSCLFLVLVSVIIKAFFGV